MRVSSFAVIGVGILSAVLALEPAHAGQSAEAEGQCQLINTQQGRDLYSGDCTITETVKNNGQMTVWDIRMGSSEPFLFACQPNGDCMHGPEEVEFKDHGNSASFRWSNFRLEVHQGRSDSRSQAGGGSNSQGGGGVAVADMARYCAGEASAKFQQRPQNISTQPAIEDQGMYSVFGQFPPSGADPTVFICTFTKDGDLVGVDKE